MSSALDPALVQVLTFLDLFILSWLSTITYALMINKRLNSEIKESKDKFELIFEISPIATIITSLEDGKIVKVNQKFVKLSGYSEDEAIGRTSSELKLYKSNSERNILFEEIKKSSEYKKSEVKFQNRNSDEIIGITSSKEIFLDNKPHALTMVHDITERKKIENDLAHEKNHLRTTLISIGEGVITTDNNGNVLLMNNVAEILTGWKFKEVVGKPVQEFFRVIYEITKEKCATPNKRVLDDANNLLEKPMLLITKEGKEISTEESLSPIIDKNKNMSGVVIVFRDITEKREKQKKIEYLSYHDHLTGLYNRRYYEEELRRLDTERNLPLSIIMADANKLKFTNDIFGHNEGDELLKRFAEVLKRECRSDEIIARIGGDEFVIVLAKTDIFEVNIIIERIEKSVRLEKLRSGLLSVSMGSAVKKYKYENVEDVFNAAENEIYKVKLTEKATIGKFMIYSILENIFQKSEREKNHSINVCNLCKELAKVMGLSNREIELSGMVGTLHDIDDMLW